MKEAMGVVPLPVIIIQLPMKNNNKVSIKVRTVSITVSSIIQTAVWQIKIMTYCILESILNKYIK